MARLDKYITENKQFETRSKAQNAIKASMVKVNDKIITNCGYEVSDKDIIVIDQDSHKYVSRGGEKLEKAIDSFNINLVGKTVLDIGASTGGFTDCCLQKGAKRVYSYDVGEQQLADKLKSDNRVVLKENVNARYLTRNDFKEDIDFICMDVSFISCTKIFEAISSIANKTSDIIVLFKPQFEVGSQYLNGQGIVINDKITRDKLVETEAIAKTFGLSLIKTIDSPIRGKKGNNEYLLYLKKD